MYKAVLDLGGCRGERERSTGADGGAFGADTQPGDRAPAPGDLALVQAFVNSFWDLDQGQRELWPTPTVLAQWLIERGLLEPRTGLGRDDLRRTLDVREGLRALLFANNGAEVDQDAREHLNRALRGPGLFVQLSGSAPPLMRAWRRDLDGALAMIATIVAMAQLDGSWYRMKACRGERCGWTFYDHSRNQGGNWCSMSICGSRSKARAYRRRRGRAAGA